jgi:hypothetical protein
VRGNELARHLDDRRQIEDDSGEPRVRLARRDAVGPRAAAEIEHAPAAREIHLAREATPRAETDGIGRLVILPRRLHRETLGVPAEHHRRVLAPQVLGQAAPFAPVGLREEDPRPRVVRRARYEVALDVRSVPEALARAFQEPEPDARAHDALRIAGREIERRREARLGVGAPRHSGEELELDGGHEGGRLPVGARHALQADGIDPWLGHVQSSTLR